MRNQTAPLNRLGRNLVGSYQLSDIQEASRDDQVQTINHSWQTVRVDGSIGVEKKSHETPVPVMPVLDRIGQGF